jgi:TonB-linked SusC/RagA family outer membrane protein
MLFISSAAIAQFSISGTVTDETGEPLIGVNVSIKGTTIGNITDLDGKYTIQAPNEQAVLVFSFIGYRTVEAVIGSQRVIDLQLKEDTQALEEIVVVGYGVQKKVTVTGSVASVSGEELKASPTTNITNAMVGRMPGVIGFQKSDEPGGGGTTIRIRGTNSLGSKDPLIVIDGVPGREGGMDRINPNEIESISVLKDAAAAIYGSRAANGVILVTTKRGKEGKPSVIYSGNTGFSSPTRMPVMANAFEYATMINDIDRYQKREHRYTAEDLQMFKDGSDPWGHPNTNYRELAIKDISPIYRHDLAITGGNDRAKYYVSLAANGEDGIYKRSANRYDQYSVRTNLDIKANDYLDISYGNISRLQVHKYPTYSADEVFTAIVRSKPTDIGFWPSGEAGPDLEYGHNPVVMGTDATGHDTRKSYYIQNTLKAVLKIPGVKGLTLTGSGSYDKFVSFRKKFRTPYLLYTWNGNPEHNLTSGWKGPATPELEQWSEDQTFWMANAIASYDFSISEHNFGISAGIEAEDKQQNDTKGFRKYFLSSSLDELNNGGVAEMSNEGSSWEENRLNYFGRVTYNFKERYLFEFVWRADGSYRFPKNKRYGFFPGVSAAWRISEENFWKDNVSFINYFKLRGSASQTGNDALLDSDNKYDRSIQYLNTYGFGTDYLFGSTFQKTLKPTRTPNPNITWEVGTTYDIGFDLKFLNNRLSLEADVFYHKRTNMLINRNASLPEISGITLPKENLGEMSNRGVEALVTWNDRIGTFEYDLGFNMTYARNKIDFWDETPNIPDYQKSTGRTVDAHLYYKTDGVFNTQEELDSYPHWAGARLGDLKFVDYNGDGVINGDDRVRIDKNDEPRFVAGFTVNGRWKNFDLMLLFQGAAGAQEYIWRERAGEAGNFYKWTYDHRWTEENWQIEHPRTYNRETEYWARNDNTSNSSDYFLWSKNYVRLKNAELGYTFKFPAIRNIGIQNLRIYANATNIFTLDKIRIQDPEASDTGKEYPQRRVFNFGLSVTF